MFWSISSAEILLRPAEIAYEPNDRHFGIINKHIMWFIAQRVWKFLQNYIILIIRIYSVMFNKFDMMPHYYHLLQKICTKTGKIAQFWIKYYLFFKMILINKILCEAPFLPHSAQKQYNSEISLLIRIWINIHFPKCQKSRGHRSEIPEFQSC